MNIKPKSLSSKDTNRVLEAFTELIKNTIDNGNLSDRRMLVHSLIGPIEELSQDDFFGTEGWQHRSGLED